MDTWDCRRDAWGCRAGVGRRPRCTALRSTPAVALRARVRKTAPDSRSALATAAYLKGVITS